MTVDAKCKQFAGKPQSSGDLKHRTMMKNTLVVIFNVE